MLTHDEVWRGIDRLATAKGYSASGLAKQAGLDPTSFNKSKRVSASGKERWPSMESISKILSVTGATMSDFISLIGKDIEGAISAMPRHIPLIGFAQAGEKGFFDTEGYPSGGSWDEIQFPENSQINDNHLYALEVSGNSMEPLYREGDRLIVSPDSNFRRGDRVIVKTTGGEVMAKELKRQSAAKVELKSLNESYEDRSLEKSEIEWMARIMWVSQ